MAWRRVLLVPAVAAMAFACSSSSTDTPRAITDVGKACRASSECESGSCAPLVGVDPGADRRAVCTRECAADADCLGGWACSPVPGGPSVCVCAPSTETCDGKDNDCNGIVDDHEAHCEIPPPPPPCVEAACCKASETYCGVFCVDLKADAKNCGACGAICADGAACVAGVCRCGADRTVACGPDAPTRSCQSDDRCHERTTVVEPAYKTTIGELAITKDAVFYVASTFSLGGQIDRLSRFAKVGAPKPAVVFGSTTTEYVRTASDGSNIVYATNGIANVPPPQVWSCPLGDCTNKVLLANEDARAFMLAFGGDLYWLDAARTEIRSCALAGCATTPTAVPIGAGSGLGVAAGDSSGLYVSTKGGTVDHIALADGTRTVLATAQPGIQQLVVDATSIYWSTNTGIYGCKKAGCTPAQILASNPVGALRAEAGQLYWVGVESILTCAASSCATPRTLVRPKPGEGAIVSFALDTDFVYFGLQRSTGIGVSLERIDR